MHIISCWDVGTGVVFVGEQFEDCELVHVGWCGGLWGQGGCGLCCWVMCWATDVGCVWGGVGVDAAGSPTYGDIYIGPISTTPPPQHTLKKVSVEFPNQTPLCSSRHVSPVLLSVLHYQHTCCGHRDPTHIAVTTMFKCALQSRVVLSLPFLTRGGVHARPHCFHCCHTCMYHVYRCAS